MEPVDPDELVLFHEKGTLYVNAGVPGLDASLRPVGRPSDVAFPGHRGAGYVCQRTHCYFTNRRIVFAGKGIDINIALPELKDVIVEPGGVVFETANGIRLAFTFQNPLIAADVIGLAKAGSFGQVLA